VHRGRRQQRRDRRQRVGAWLLPAIARRPEQAAGGLHAEGSKVIGRLSCKRYRIRGGPEFEAWVQGPGVEATGAEVSFGTDCIG
jgi:hypothetical protein